MDTISLFDEHTLVILYSLFFRIFKIHKIFRKIFYSTYSSGLSNKTRTISLQTANKVTRITYFSKHNNNVQFISIT